MAGGGPAQTSRGIRKNSTSQRWGPPKTCQDEKLKDKMPSLLSTTQKTYGPSQKEWKTVAVKAKLGGDELKKISVWGELLGSCVWAIQRHDGSRLTSLLFHTCDDQGFWFPKAGQIMTLPERSLGNGLEHTSALNVFLCTGTTENDFLTPGKRSWEHLGLSPSGIMGTPKDHLQGSLPGNLSGLLVCYQSSRHSFVCLLLHISMCVFTCLCRCICICVPVCGGWS